MGIITLARFLAQRDATFGGYLKTSLAHAEAAKLTDADLAVLRLLVQSIAC